MRGPRSKSTAQFITGHVSRCIGIEEDRRRRRSGEADGRSECAFRKGLVWRRLPLCPAKQERVRVKSLRLSYELSFLCVLAAAPPLSHLSAWMSRCRCSRERASAGQHTVSYAPNAVNTCLL